MNTIAATSTASLPPTTGTSAAAPAASGATTTPLGATTLPAAGPAQDAMIATLKQLVSVLSALIEALQGAQAVGGGPAAKGGGPVQTPVQAPTQVPTQAPTQGGGAAAAPVATASTATPTTSTAPATATTAVPSLQPVSADYTGPYMSSDQYSSGGGYSTAIQSGSADLAALGQSASLQFMGRFGTGPGTVHLSSAQVPIGTRINMPDSGSVSLSTGTTFSWTSTLRTDRFGMTSAEPTFSVTRGGQGATAFSGATIDQVDGFGERVSSPLSSREIAELVNALAARYPHIS